MYVQLQPLFSANSLLPSKDDDSKGYYISATIIEAKDPKAPTMTEEIFGPVLTVYAYDDDKWEEILTTIDSTSQYGLTGSMCASLTPLLHDSC